MKTLIDKVFDYKKISEMRGTVNNDSINLNSSSMIKDVWFNESNLASIRERLKDEVKKVLLDYDLLFLLNKLDSDIDNNLGFCNHSHLQDPKFIKSIFESSIVDNKERFGEALELAEAQSLEYKNELIEEIKKYREGIMELKGENEKYEDAYKGILKYGEE